MPEHIDLFDSTYGHFTDDVIDAIQKETYGIDLGQNSWLTADEYDRFLLWLRLTPDEHVLEWPAAPAAPPCMPPGRPAAASPASTRRRRRRHRE